ncbi:hypothetical protein ACIBF5_02360 [Micromonospora sp. NPDC050417]|uniref:hypothetical protein n=1 Tax=Micromonospora sp. NPDC050417 TaxID=3364280 RepID=UPI0037AC144A
MPENSVASVTFGSHDDIATLMGKVGQALDVEFELRDSEYHGGDYYLSRSGRGVFVIRWNRELDEPAEPDRPELSTLLYASIPVGDVPSVTQAMALLQLETLARLASHGNPQGS